MEKVGLDRRIATSSSKGIETQLLSQLRNKPFVVLLGEPGIGKSTALQFEATAEGGDVLTCREVMNGAALSSSKTAYLDALDEFRSGGDGKDKLIQLSNALKTAGVRRWRLTCRAEDWRKAADLFAMERAAEGGTIEVVQLLPLEDDEVQTILSVLSEVDPEGFVKQAHQRGAEGFLQSPLSLKLLHSAVATNGEWPTSRFELFEKATWNLAHELDKARSTDPRPAPNDVLGAAGRICLYVLSTHARAIWRSNAPPPGLTDGEYLTVLSLPIERSVADAALDTALFRGEGESFEPVHRSIAEFLGGQALAKAVVGSRGRPAFPLRRALALITGSDGKAPSELRGLYAWFAAHLAREGDNAGAIRLVGRDAATVLAYGDAAAFSTAGRRALLLNLDRDDPFFRTSQRNDSTVVGGLAGEDLADDFRSILDSPARASHLQVTVLNALVDGRPVKSLQSKLHEIAVDHNRPLWQRSRAAQAWINGAPISENARRLLLQELSATELSHDQIALRADLTAQIPTDQLSLDEIRRLLSEFENLPRSAGDEDANFSGTLTSLLIHLKRAPRADLFDQPLFAAPRTDIVRTSEVRHFINQVLAGTIVGTSNLNASRLWTWIKNSREYEWDMIESDVAEAIGFWVNQDVVSRERELFLVLMEDSPSDEGPWMVVNHYVTLARRLPTIQLFRVLLQFAMREKTEKRRRIIEVAAYAARTQELWPLARDELFATLRAEGGFEDLIKGLNSDPNERWQERQNQKKEKTRAETEQIKQNNIETLTPLIASIADGDPAQYSVLAWASKHYYGAVIDKGGSDPLSNIVRYTNPEIALAIGEGLLRFASRGVIEVNAADLGRAEANHRSYGVEQVVAAGIHRALVAGREKELATCPLVVAIVAIRHGYFKVEESPSLSSWAMNRLGREVEEGAQELLTYWGASLDAGDEDLDGIHYLEKSLNHGLAVSTLYRLLLERPGMSDRALRQALLGCANRMQPMELQELASSALTNPLVLDEQRRLWLFVAFAIDPLRLRDELDDASLRECLLTPDGALAQALLERCPAPEAMDSIRIASLGAVYEPDPDDWRGEGSASLIVRAAIRRLGGSNQPLAGELLSDLITLTLPNWKPELQHALAEHMRLLRDSKYRPPTTEELTLAISGGCPANPADLIAVVTEELERYQATLRTGSETPWKRFWNTDRNGVATSPQVENEDRDRLLELLRPRFEHYGIIASLPEARRGENTRADVLLLSHAGKNLPIEAKRHYNNELWTAPSEQLRGYAADDGASGYGVYLVFWFGPEFRPPSRLDGKSLPTTAADLEKLLIGDLPADMADRTLIIVLDVSRPGSYHAPRKRKTSKTPRQGKP